MFCMCALVNGRSKQLFFFLIMFFNHTLFVRVDGCICDCAFLCAFTSDASSL